MIAVHAGAGYHAKSKHSEYKELCRQACIEGISCLKSNGTGLDAATRAVQLLEDAPCTNAGRGSNLTLGGEVECDASIMDGLTRKYGAVGALPGVPNPIRVCKSILENQLKPRVLGRVPSCLLSGSGANTWAVEHGIEVTAPQDMVTGRSRKSYHHHRRTLDRAELEGKSNDVAPWDTVGAICVDGAGHVTSAVSSGGILLKTPGRLGQACQFGCGCWAENYRDGTHSHRGVAVSTSGCGEHLIYSQLAQKCGEKLKSHDNPTAAILEVFTDNLLGQNYVC